MQTLIRSLIGGLALGGVVLACGLAAMFAGSAMGFASGSEVMMVGMVSAIVLIGAATMISMRRAVAGLRSGLTQSTATAAATAPRWMRPVFRALGEQHLLHQQAEAAWRTRQRDLEIRAHVADEARMQSQAVLDVMDEGVLVCNTMREIISTNAAAGRLLGFDPSQVIGRPIAEVVNHVSVLEIIKSTLEAGTGAEPRRGEVSVETAGRQCPCGVVSASVSDHRERLSAVVTVLHDLSREREISQMKSEFVSKASHELRTPLSSMRAYVEMLVDGEADDEKTRHEFYDIIQSETDRLARLVDNMLNISRIEAGIMEVDRSSVDMRSLIDRAVQTIDPQAREKNISLHSELAPVGTVVDGDGDMLQQVILNLLSNAVKYTPEGGRVTVSLDADTLTRSVHVAVSDTGLGIGPKDAAQVFEKFYRVENYKRVADGTGLGLNLCRHIIETVHSGQIGLDSTLGMGSRFWFSVPLSQHTACVAA